MKKNQVLKYSLYLALFVVFTHCRIINAQVIYETNDKNIDRFFGRLDQKGIIKVNQSIYPYSKSKIRQYLNDIEFEKLSLSHLFNGRRDSVIESLNFHDLTFLDHQQLSWYSNKYSLENGKSSKILGEFTLIEENLRLRLLPIIGYSRSTTGNQNGHSRKIGVHINAYLGDNLGIMFQYLDTGEFGDNVDEVKLNSSQTGYFYKFASNGIEFSDVRGQINYSWDWGVISLKKDYNRWGHGKYGQLILSDKASSFPHFQIELRPTKWLSLNYLHGWLNSLIIDSTKILSHQNSEFGMGEYREYLPKYFAANYLSLLPNDWLTVSVGNSFIYSGDLRPETFIPIMYYKVMDHNTGRGDVGDGNGIIFFDIGIKYPNNFLFYGTMIADVINIRGMLDGQWHKQWVGYTFGGSIVDLGIDNLDFTIEYTRNNPWIYENKYDLTNYKHLNYSLGHWIGQNADLIATEFNYSPIRGLSISLKWLQFRKGGLSDIQFAYENPTPLPFLYGEKRLENRILLNVDYEFMYNIYLQGYYSYSDITDEKEDRTPEFMLGNKHSFSLALSYGLPF